MRREFQVFSFKFSVGRLGARLAVGVVLLAGVGVFGADQELPAGMRLEALPLAAPEPADNRSSPGKIALGRLLFFDPILSSTKEVSCATCHNPRFGWADGRATSIGVGGAGIGPARLFRDASSTPLITRNAPTILNTGFTGLVAGVKPDPATAPLFWDSRVHGLEEQVFTPLRSAGEMRGGSCSEDIAVEQAVRRLRGVEEYRQRFRAAFGPTTGEAITAENMARAIAAFERSLISPPTPVDRFLSGDAASLNALQQRGLKVFQEAGCAQCHGGPMFSDYKLHFIGAPGAGADDRREFRTPTLRNLRHTAPYMHNGGMRTLREVLVFYDALSETVSESLDGADKTFRPALDPLLKHLNLAPEDFPALEAFLDALSVDDYNKDEPGQVPSGLPVIR